MRTLLQAEPHPLEIDTTKLGIVVIEMQNAFVSKGGMIDLWGLEISSKIIEPIGEILTAARRKGIKVIYITHRYSPDLRESGGSHSPNWYQEALSIYREHPEWHDKLLIRGTWGADIVDELRPEEGDIVLEKPRHCAFYGTNLDTILKTFGIKYLFFMGAGTNICVEASIRDAFNLDYFSILVSDASANVGPPFTQDATIFNIKVGYGWVTSTSNVLQVIG